MRLRTEILLTILVWFAAGAWAAAQTAPVLSFDRKAVVFDTLSFRNGPVKAVFECTNISSKPVHILDVRTYCSCLQVQYEKKAIRPGQKALVRAVLLTDRLNAWQEHRFTVLASDGGEVMTSSLKLSGYVKRD